MPWARFDDEGGMVSEDEEVGMDFFEAAYVTTDRGSTPALNDFDDSKYDGEWLQIGGFLRTMTPNVSWTKDEANRIRKKAWTGTCGNTRRRGTASRSEWWR